MSKKVFMMMGGVLLGLFTFIQWIHAMSLGNYNYRHTEIFFSGDLIDHTGVWQKYQDIGSHFDFVVYDQERWGDLNHSFSITFFMPEPKKIFHIHRLTFFTLEEEEVVLFDTTKSFEMYDLVYARDQPGFYRKYPEIPNPLMEPFLDRYVARPGTPFDRPEFGPFPQLREHIIGKRTKTPPPAEPIPIWIKFVITYSFDEDEEIFVEEFNKPAIITRYPKDLDYLRP